MTSLINKNRPPVYCPGCTHDRITRSLDKAFQNMGLQGNEIVIVTDIGCSGLFDTFFNTHAFHGLHGRALTYAAGLKLARPELNVIVTMGDGGMGIGGAHFLSACRRNLDLTLLVLNNFNFGMTGGQFSATTPAEAQVGSGFLNQLERPLDVCDVACAAGATYASRISGFSQDLVDEMERAVGHEGFSVVDIWGLCTGRYTRRNRLTPQAIKESIEILPSRKGEVAENSRKEYGKHYREIISKQKPVPEPVKIDAKYQPPQSKREEVIILGGAGQRVVTAGEILCIAGLFAGLQVTQKNEYNITVLKGPSISEVILSTEEIGFTGIEKASAIIAISQEGVDRRTWLFDESDDETLVLHIPDVEVPSCKAKVLPMDLKAQGIKGQDWALASLAVLAKLNRVINLEMLKSALDFRFKDKVLFSAKELVNRVQV